MKNNFVEKIFVYKNQTVPYLVYNKPFQKSSTVRIRKGQIIIVLGQYANANIENSLLLKVVDKYLSANELYFNIKNSSFVLFNKKVFYQIYSNMQFTTIELIDSNNLEKITTLNLFNINKLTKENNSNLFYKSIELKINNYIKEQLKYKINIFQKEIALFYDTFNPEFSLYNKDRTWGINYLTKKKIYYNFKLYIFDDETLKCVIAHEIVHNFIPSHSKKFYLEVKKYCPNYKQSQLKMSKMNLFE
ncbi:M48 family metallopeptidase [Mycoplasmopsis cricetuli]|uniref:M48 family metallopeptidase n=1 Tax=Mycoplasmopsis cricetuli TaxID=171283 RepID=UPI000472DCA8|nr:M48 family metallopeptidase [Mycoplasmopsis cricetuli]